MELNARKYAKAMRNEKVSNDGSIICSLEVWERIASMIEDQADEIDRLLNFICKIDRQQEEHIQENYVPYEQYEELLEENKDLKYKLEETYLSAEGLKIENVKLKEENKQLKAKRYLLKADGNLEMIPTIETVRAETVDKMVQAIRERLIEGGICPVFVKNTIDRVAKEIMDET